MFQNNSQILVAIVATSDNGTMTEGVGGVEGAFGFMTRSPSSMLSGFILVWRFGSWATAQVSRQALGAGKSVTRCWASGWLGQSSSRATVDSRAATVLSTGQLIGGGSGSGWGLGVAFVPGCPEISSGFGGCRLGPVAKWLADTFRTIYHCFYLFNPVNFLVNFFKFHLLVAAAQGPGSGGLVFRLL
jgi:hypothetical protein